MRRTLSKKRVREIATGYSAVHDVETVPLAEEVARSRENNDRIARDLVTIFYLYKNYKVDSRGPAGCIYDALNRVAPRIAKELDDCDAGEVYRKHWGED